MSLNTIPLFAPLGWVSLLFRETSQSYVEIIQGTYFDGDFTVTAWIYVPGKFSSWTTIVDFGNGANDDNVVLALSDGIPFLATFSGSQKTQMLAEGNRPIPLDTWIHIAGFVNASGTGRLFCNGQQVGTQTGMHVPGAVTRTHNFFGKSNWSSKSYTNAILRDIRILSKALDPTANKDSSNERNAAGSQSGSRVGDDSLLIARWRCWEGYGDVVFDDVAVSDAASQYGVLGGGDSARMPMWVVASQPFPQSRFARGITNRGLSVNSDSRPDPRPDPQSTTPTAPVALSTSTKLPTSVNPEANTDAAWQNLWAPWVGLEKQSLLADLLPMSAVLDSNSRSAATAAAAGSGDNPSASDTRGEGS